MFQKRHFDKIADILRSVEAKDRTWLEVVDAFAYDLGGTESERGTFKPEMFRRACGYYDVAARVLAKHGNTF